MAQILTGTLASVAHLDFGLFNLAVPNVIVWIGIVLVLGMATWLRLPAFFEPVPVRAEVDR